MYDKIDDLSEKIVVCLPTYNEASNIRVILSSIRKMLPHAFILVADDSSPDGTGQIADDLATCDPRIHVLHRPAKQGLGIAYMQAFQYAMDYLGADLVVQMDADLSHPVETLPAMIAAARDNDLVIGSRYVAGGSTENWNIFRQIISRFGSAYARFFLGLPIHDTTSGFKVWKQRLLKQVVKQRIASSGYVFQIETSFTAYRMGARIREIPINFIERTTGKSKMTLSIAFEAMWRVPLIRFSKKKKLLPYHHSNGE